MFDKNLEWQTEREYTCVASRRKVPDDLQTQLTASKGKVAGRDVARCTHQDRSTSLMRVVVDAGSRGLGFASAGRALDKNEILRERSVDRAALTSVKRHAARKVGNFGLVSDGEGLHSELGIKNPSPKRWPHRMEVAAEKREGRLQAIEGDGNLFFTHRVPGRAGGVNVLAAVQLSSDMGRVQVDNRAPHVQEGPVSCRASHNERVADDEGIARIIREIRDGRVRRSPMDSEVITTELQRQSTIFASLKRDEAREYVVVVREGREDHWRGRGLFTKDAVRACTLSRVSDGYTVVGHEPFGEPAEEAEAVAQDEWMPLIAGAVRGGGSRRNGDERSSVLSNGSKRKDIGASRDGAARLAFAER